MRRAPAALLSSLFCSLPAAGSALVILSVPPVSLLVPPLLLAPIREAARVPFELIGMIPPDSLAGRLFYGSYESLVPIFGSSALAVHAGLLALPWLVLALAFARRARSSSPRGPLGALEGQCART